MNMHVHTLPSSCFLLRITQLNTGPGTGTVPYPRLSRNNILLLQTSDTKVPRARTCRPIKGGAVCVPPSHAASTLAYRPARLACCRTEVHRQHDQWELLRLRSCKMWSSHCLSRARAGERRIGGFSQDDAKAAKAEPDQLYTKSIRRLERKEPSKWSFPCAMA